MGTNGRVPLESAARGFAPKAAPETQATRTGALDGRQTALAPSASTTSDRLRPILHARAIAVFHNEIGVRTPAHYGGGSQMALPKAHVTGANSSDGSRSPRPRTIVALKRTGGLVCAALVFLACETAPTLPDDGGVPETILPPET